MSPDYFFHKSIRARPTLRAAQISAAGQQLEQLALQVQAVVLNLNHKKWIMNLKKRNLKKKKKKNCLCQQLLDYDRHSEEES